MTLTLSDEELQYLNKEFIELESNSHSPYAMFIGGFIKAKEKFNIKE